MGLSTLNHFALLGVQDGMWIRSTRVAVGAGIFVSIVSSCTSDGGGEGEGEDNDPVGGSPMVTSGGSSAGGEGTGGALGGASATGGGGSDPTGTSVIVAVGYSGIKMRSLDGGITWGEAQIDPQVGVQEDPECDPETTDCKLLCSGGDDRCLLRHVTFAEGLFVAVGWKIFTSADGFEWTERTVEGQQWMGGVQYGNDLWLAVGGCGDSVSSLDGISWNDAANVSEGCGHVRDLAYGNGVFVATGAYTGGDLAGTPIAVWAVDDSDFTPIGETDLAASVEFDGAQFISPSASNEAVHYTSPDGESWTQTDGPAPLLPVLPGVYLRAAQERIERSEDGQTWDIVADDLPGTITAFAACTVEL